MKKLILSLVTAGAVLASAHAFAETIIEDDMGNSNVNNFSGRIAEPTDLPGSQWVFQGSYNEGINTTDQYGYMYADEQAEISVASNLSEAVPYVEPSVLNISGLVIPQGITEDGDSGGRGEGLGFFNVDTGAGHGISSFSGIILSPAGTLILDDNGVKVAGVATPYLGADNAGGGTLSYNYDTLTGAITDVIYNGTNYSSIFAGHDVEAGDSYAGWEVYTPSGSEAGVLEDFVVGTAATPSVPEPGTDALFALGGCLVLAGWLRFRRSKA